MQWHVSAQEKGCERETNIKVSEKGYQKNQCCVSIFCATVPSCCVQLVGAALSGRSPYLVEH